MSIGRTTEPRSVTVTTTNASANVTAAAGTFSQEDVGRTITGTGIPPGTTVLSVASDTAATLSANATAAGSSTVTLGQATTAVGYLGWSPETAAESQTYTVAAKNAGVISPSMLTNPFTRTSSRGRG